jgi:hypothetical protein
MQIPDYIEEVVAYRVWLWDDEGARSINGTRWTPGVAMVAQNIHCRASSHFPYRELSGWGGERGHEGPGIRCGCGLYAAKNWKHLIEIGYDRHIIDRTMSHTSRRTPLGIHGEVSLWGKIEECSLGYRAQYAYPRHFVIPLSALDWPNNGVEERLKTLIAFNVDIYVSKDSQPQAEIEKVPLWIKDFGYTQQGISLLLESAQHFRDWIKSLNISFWPDLVWSELDDRVDKLKAIRDKAEPPRLTPSRRTIPSWNTSVISGVHTGEYRPRSTGLGLRTLIQILRGRSW